MSLESTESRLGNWLKEQAASRQEQQVNSVEGQPAEPQPTEEPSKVEPQEAPKEPETPVDPSPENEAPESWDEPETEVVSETPPVVDFKKIGSALELGEIKDENELIAKVSSLKTQKGEELPNEIKEALELAKRTGDWRPYLREHLVEQDFSRLKPEEIYEEQIFAEAQNIPEWKNPDGSINEEAVYAYIDSIPKPQRIFQGKQIQQQLVATQQARKAQIVRQAQERIEVADKSLGTATKSLNEILPFEQYGIKFESSHASKIYEGVTSSKLTKKHLGISYEDLVKNGADMKALTATIAKAEYAEQMLKFKSKNSATQAKKELLSKTQNAQITTPGTAARPEDSEKREPTAVEKLAQHLKNQKKNIFG